MAKKISATDEKINEISLAADSFEDSEIISSLLKDAGYKLIGILVAKESVYAYENEVYYSKNLNKFIIKFVDNDEFIVVKKAEHKKFLKNQFSINL